jgi:colanic acid biosynthesis glycosyl transferase WcaI
VAMFAVFASHLHSLRESKLGMIKMRLWDAKMRAAATDSQWNAVKTSGHARRVLLLTQWYPPEPTVRPEQLALGLRDRGYEVTVVTSYPSYPHGRVYPGYSQRFRSASGSNPKVIRVPSFPSRSMSLLHRGLSYATFALAAAFGVATTRRSAIIWAYQPPPSITLPALFAKAIHRAPVVLEIQDMWPDTLVASGLKKEGRLTRFIAKAMSWILSKVDWVVVISNGFASLLVNRGVPRDRISVIPNWPTVPTRSVGPLGGNRDGGRFRLLYAGNIGPGQRLDFLVRAISTANRTRPAGRLVSLTLLGDGPALPTVARVAEEAGIDFEVLPRVAPAEVPEIAAAYDALLVNLANDPVFRSTIPSKLITYLAMGKPVLAGLAGDGAHVVESADAGLAFAPGDFGAAVDSLSRLADATSEELASMGENARRAFEEQFQADILIDRYGELFEDLIAEQTAKRKRGRR